MISILSLYASLIPLTWIIVQSDICFQLLAVAFARTMTMVAEQVVKDDDGNEVCIHGHFNVVKLNCFDIIVLLR